LALSGAGPTLLGVPVLFLLFGLTLAGILISHRRALQVALAGLAVMLVVRVGFTHFDLAGHLGHEWAKLVNLCGLLIGFAVVADHFETSGVPAQLPRLLPRGGAGAFTMLFLIWMLSGILDNIAAAMIGASAAARAFNNKLQRGYLVAIVAAANAGGAGSVLGDTTTTMIWIEGVSPLRVLPAYVGAAAALLVFGPIASWRQSRHAPLVAVDSRGERIDAGRLVVVAGTLVLVVATNLISNLVLGARAAQLPLLAGALWLGLLGGAVIRRPRLRPIAEAGKGSVFLLALVLAASLMPVEALPPPDWRTTLALGAVSSVFDNIPLTKLALDQGGYNWAELAYSVGVGGSMLWFGSSAGVAVAGRFPEAKSAVAWLRDGWHVPLGFLFGYLVLLLVTGR